MARRSRRRFCARMSPREGPSNGGLGNPSGPRWWTAMALSARSPTAATNSRTNGGAAEKATIAPPSFALSTANLYAGAQPGLSLRSADRESGRDRRAPCRRFRDLRHRAESDGASCPAARVPRFRPACGRPTRPRLGAGPAARPGRDVRASPALNRSWHPLAPAGKPVSRRAMLTPNYRLQDLPATRHRPPSARSGSGGRGNWCPNRRCRYHGPPAAARRGAPGAPRAAS